MATAALSTRSLSQAPALAAPVVLLGRLLFALIFLMAGPNNFSGQTIAYAASQGVPLASIAVPLSGVLAIVGGLSILLGYRARTERSSHVRGIRREDESYGPRLCRIFSENCRQREYRQLYQSDGLGGHHAGRSEVSAAHL